MKNAAKKAEEVFNALKVATITAKMALTGLFMGIPVMTVHADPQEQSSGNQLDVETIIKSGKSLDDSSLSKLGEKVDDIGGGSYALVFKIGTWGVVIAIAITGIAFLFVGARNRDEVKSNVPYKLIGAVMIFGAVALTLSLAKIGESLFGL